MGTQFNQGNSSYLAQAYTADSVMLTHPVGVIYRSKAILSFWSELINSGATNLLYIEPTYELIDPHTQCTEKCTGK